MHLLVVVVFMCGLQGLGMPAEPRGWVKSSWIEAWSKIHLPGILVLDECLSCSGEEDFAGADKVCPVYNCEGLPDIMVCNKDAESPVPESRDDFLDFEDIFRV